MAITRPVLIREPGKLIWDSGHFYFQGDILVKPVATNADIMSSVHGTIDSRQTNRMFTISGTLAGEWEELAKLYSLMSLKRGASVFGSTDKPLVIHCLSGLKITFVNGAITKPPVIIGKAGATMFGAFEAMCIVGNGLDPSAVASFYAITSEAYPGDSQFAPSSILTLPLGAVWGASAPWDAFHTQSGWTITPNVTLAPEDVDGLGTVDMKIQDMTVTATATPVGVTQAQLYAAMGHGAGYGAVRTGAPLVLSASGVWMQITDAIITDGDSGHGDRLVVGEVTWTGRRTWTDGVINPLLAVGTAAPE